MKRIMITGDAARDIARHVRTIPHLHSQFVEVQGMRECKYGCKLHVKRQGAVLLYRLIHSPSYGCALGRDENTRVIPVSVRPAA